MLADKGLSREQIENCTIEWAATVVFAPRDSTDGTLLIYKRSGMQPGKRPAKPQSQDPIDMYEEVLLAKGYPKHKVKEVLDDAKKRRDSLLREAGL